MAGETRYGVARRDWVGHGEAWSGAAGQDRARQDRAWGRAMSPETQWRRIVGWTPTLPRPLVLEQLSCGHAGKRSEQARVEQRIAEGRTRLCVVCTRQVQAAAKVARAQAVCRTKVPYLSAASAQAAVRRLGGQAYRCPACAGWHRTTKPGKPA